MRPACRVLPGQMELDLFAAPPATDRDAEAVSACVAWLASRGCDEGRVAPMVGEIFGSFGRSEGFDRAKCLEYFYGNRPIPSLRACPPSLIGVFDRSVDYHVVWDRCWAARWVPLREVYEVAEWKYNYRSPYTGEPVWVWYIDVDGREVKRPYGEEMECEG